MSFLFGNLFTIRRGKELFYCFLEARVKLFPSIEEDRISNAIKFLGINILACTQQEHIVLQKHLPSEFAPFALLSQQNLLLLQKLLLDFSQVQNKMPNLDIQFPFATKSSFLQGSSHASADTSATMASEPWLVQSRLGERANENFASDNYKCNVNDGPRNESRSPVEAGTGDGRHLASDFSSYGDKCIEHGESSSKSQPDRSDGRHLADLYFGGREENPVSNPPTPALAIPICEDSPGKSSVCTDDTDERKKKPGATLAESEMSPRLRSELCEIRRFYSIDLNCDREGNALQSNTIDKMLERTLGFLWFLRNVKSVEPAFVHCANPQFVQEFVHFLMNKRRIKAITCSRYLTALINVCKVPLDSDGSKERHDLSESLEKIRAVQRQLERAARKERVDDLARKPELERVVYSELLELCRELKWEVAEKSGTCQARSCMNLCMLLLYCAANPGRAKEYITLRIYKGQSDDQSKNENFICFNEADGTVMLLEDAYKTRPTYGPNRTDLTPLTFLTYYLKLYRSQMRPLLLNGKEHDYFFVNPRGDQFSQASYSNYTSALFEKYFSLKVTTVDIRKAVVNHFLTLPQSSDHSLRESFATLMKHSVRTQKRYYDERPLAQKKSKALDLLGSMASRSLGEDSVEIVSDEDQEGNIEYLPGQGEFVALVAANSTRIVPEVFVAKVLRLSEDRKTAHLSEFTETEPGKFKLSAGKSYREAVSALVYPIDIVYLHSNGVYELRTPKLEIHHQVHKTEIIR